MLIEKRHKIGNIVKIHKIMVYPVHPDLEEGMEVRIVARDMGQITVERDGKQYQVAACCINPGVYRT